MNVRPTDRERGRRWLGDRWTVLGLVPLVLTLTGLVRAEEPVGTSATVEKPTNIKASDDGAPQPIVNRVASVDRSSSTRIALKPVVNETSLTGNPAASPIDRAIRLIAECRARYQSVDDYTCTFYKRERIEGRHTPQYIMSMKVRTKPQSVYFRFQRPAQGREAIFIAGRNGGKILAHDVGITKFLAGTLELEPTSSRAMEDCRHPITEAGIGPLIETLTKRWSVELNPRESKIAIHDDIVIGTNRCKMIESIHTEHRPQFLHHKVCVYIDQEVGLPIRFEAYDWPKNAKAEPELLEEYTYMQLKINVGLSDIDFDVSNTAYSFGRF